MYLIHVLASLTGLLALASLAGPPLGPRPALQPWGSRWTVSSKAAPGRVLYRYFNHLVVPVIDARVETGSGVADIDHNLLVYRDLSAMG